MTEDTLITEADIERLKARDDRWRMIDLAIKVDDELQHSPTVNLILDAIARKATEAMDALIEADPIDTKRISSLQAAIKYGRFIGDNLDAIRKNGLMAQRSLEEEGNINLDEETQNG